MIKHLKKILMILALTLGLISPVQAMEAGTFEGTAEGYGGEVKVAVTIEDDKITDIEILDHQETEGISDAALERIPQAVIDSQGVDVETVSGATVSSEALIEAISSALTAAGATEEDLAASDEEETEETEEAEDKETYTEEADVVIVGAGGAGMSAAVEVLEAGGSVLILEKMPTYGGNTIAAGSAMNAADPEKQKEQTMAASSLEVIEGLLELEAKDDHMAAWQEEIAADMEEYKANGETYLYDSPALHKLQTYVGGDYVADPELLEIFGDNALESVEWLVDLGASFQEEITAAVGATWERSHNPTQDLGPLGSSFIVPQYNYVEENGGKILYEHKAEHFIQDEDGRVIGVSGTTADGTPFEVFGNKGVILTTGGFAGNPEMREKYNKHWAEAGEDVPTTNTAGATGDGIIMAEEIGANLVGMEWIQMVPTSLAGKGITASIENSINVNQDGERFVREDGRRDELCQAILEQDQAYRIYDKHTVIDDLGGISYRGVEIESLPDGENAWMADTLEDLADQMGIPYDTLQKTVDDYNSYVDNGGDPIGRQVFGEKIEEGPFYAQTIDAAFHHTMGGVEINTKTQVLDTEGQVIPGLYAAGEVTGGIHGSNRLGGNAISDIVTFGRLAGQQVMAEE